MRLLNKQTNILDFTLSSLLRRKGKNLSLIVVYSFVVFLVTSVVFFTHSLKREAMLTLQGSPEIIVQRVVAGRHELIPIGYMDAVQQIRGVQSVKPRLWGYYYDPTTGANYTVVVSDDLETSPGAVALGRGVARTMGSYEGTVPFQAHDGSFVYLTIKGILGSESELVSSDLILMNEADFRRLFNYPTGQATDLVLSVRNPKEFTTIAAKIVKDLPDTRPILKDEILRTYDAVFDWRGGLVVVVLSGAILAFVILAWDKATGLSAEERREIGILKATGWATSDVLLMKFWEGAVVSISSFCLGVLGAYAHIFFGSFILFAPALKGWSVLYPEFALTPFLSPFHVASIFFLTVVPYTVATIVPSWRAATIDPDAVMRA